MEKIQIEAEHIVIRLPCYASVSSIYCETGWENLSVRKEVKKLTMFYKIINHQAWFGLGGWGV